MSRMKLKILEECLQDLQDFTDPKVKLEQYTTRPHIAARMLHTIQSCYGDIEGNFIADLGSGCGTLSIGASLLGAQHVVGFDIDPDALLTQQANLVEFELDNVDLVLCDVPSYLPQKFHKFFDCVIMNPPFGTSYKGADMNFLKCALSLTNNCVYSLHKTSTRQHVLKKAKDLDVKCQILAELKFDLPATYKFHRKSNVDVEVDFVRFFY